MVLLFSSPMPITKDLVTVTMRGKKEKKERRTVGRYISEDFKMNSKFEKKLKDHGCVD